MAASQLHGKIKMYVGPMFSGKTSRLISKYTGDNSSIAVRPLVDTRNGGGPVVSSHDGVSIPAVTVPHLCDVIALVHPGTRRVLVDEGQFFSDLAEGCGRLSACGCNVYVAALTGTSERGEWVTVSKLIPNADMIEHLTAVRCAVCHNRRAPFTALRADADKRAVVKIGGADTYRPVCRQCSRASTIPERL